MTHYKMTLKEFRKHASNGAIFTIKFVKRTDGTIRIMNARFGVTKYLKGGSLSYDPASHNLMGCYDVKGNPDIPDSSAGYRMINLETLIELKYKGRVWTWENGAFHSYE